MKAPVFTLRASEERGKADHGWLKARHSFSFAEYVDRAHHHFRSLRVINEDRIAGGTGFGDHGHQDMEILTYVISGRLAHRDSMGNGSEIGPGEVQYMSAGSGVTHSEQNPSPTESIHMLQIWIMPLVKGAPPRYDQRKFSSEMKQNRLCLVASGNGDDGALGIRQDAKIYASILGKGKSIEHTIGVDRGVWIQLISGELEVEGRSMNSGDGAKLEGFESFKIRGVGALSEFLVFDLR